MKFDYRDLNWLSKIETENNTVDLTAEFNDDEADIKQYIRRQGFKAVDKRPYGGCLWIEEKEGIRKLIRDLKTLGYKFRRADSPRATNYKPAYWWKPYI